MLDSKDVYSLLGLTAFYNGFFGQCSKAFTRLQSLTTIEQASLSVSRIGALLEQNEDAQGSTLQLLIWASVCKCMWTALSIERF